jgi:AraC family transcriptional regulator of arabinose operon
MDFMRNQVRNINMHEDLIYCPSVNCSDMLWIDLAGTSYCDGSYIITRSKSEIYVLEYVLEGTGIIIHNGRKYSASAGEVYILHKGSNHSYYSSKDDPWVKIWINLKGTLIEHLLEVYGIDQVVYPGNTQILDYFKAFQNELVSEKQPWELQSKCAILLHKIISSVYFNSQPSDHRQPDDASRIKRYLDQHALDSVSLEDLCSCFYKSKAQIIRIFKKKYGITPYAYLLNVKIEYAKKLLAHTQIPVKEIAARLNFADEHYFSTYFRQVENVSPTSYRINYGTDRPVPGQ